jgi:hypothetical protein
MANPIQAILKQSRSSWLLLTQSMVWIAGSIAAFLLPPPIGSSEQIRVWVRFGQFIITVIIGMLLLGALRWKTKDYVARWAAFAMLSLTLATAAFVTYQFLVIRWTANYNQQRVVIGDVLTPWGKEFQKEHSDFTPEDLVMSASGKTDQVWDRRSLEQRRLILAILYVIALPIFTVCIMSTVQALQCAVFPTDRSTQKRPVSHRRRQPAKLSPGHPRAR